MRLNCNEVCSLEDLACESATYENASQSASIYAKSFASGSADSSGKVYKCSQPKPGESASVANHREELAARLSKIEERQKAEKKQSNSEFWHP